MTGTAENPAPTSFNSPPPGFYVPVPWPPPSALAWTLILAFPRAWSSPPQSVPGAQSLGQPLEGEESDMTEWLITTSATSPFPICTHLLFKSDPSSWQPVCPLKQMFAAGPSYPLLLVPSAVSVQSCWVLVFSLVWPFVLMWTFTCCFEICFFLSAVWMKHMFIINFSILKPLQSTYLKHKFLGQWF